MFLINAQVARFLAAANDNPTLFEWAIDIGACVWLSGEILRGGIDSVMGRN